MFSVKAFPKITKKFPQSGDFPQENKNVKVGHRAFPSCGPTFSGEATVPFGNVWKGFFTVAGTASLALCPGGKQGASVLRSSADIHAAMAADSRFHGAHCAGRRHRRREVNVEGFCRASSNCLSLLFTGSKDHRKTDSDGKADWKRSLRRSLDGKVAWRKGSRESVFYHGGGQLVQRNRNLPDCPDEA